MKNKALKSGLNALALAALTFTAQVAMAQAQSAPATGLAARHKFEQTALVDAALTIAEGV